MPVNSHTHSGSPNHSPLKQVRLLLPIGRKPNWQSTVSTVPFERTSGTALKVALEGVSTGEHTST